jgi:hypothetical protein
VICSTCKAEFAPQRVWCIPQVTIRDNGVPVHHPDVIVCESCFTTDAKPWERTEHLGRPMSEWKADFGVLSTEDVATLQAFAHRLRNCIAQLEAFA